MGVEKARIDHRDGAKRGHACRKFGWRERRVFDAMPVADRWLLRCRDGERRVIRRLLAGERVTFRGSFVDVEDAVLLPVPAGRTPIMIGSNSPRMLSIALPYADVWNTWFDGYGNTPTGFASRSREIDAAAISAGRRPEDIQRSACVLVLLDGGSGERAVPPGVTPLEGPMPRIAEGLRALAAAGADEAILVVSPITEHSITALGEALALLDR